MSRAGLKKGMGNPFSSTLPAVRIKPSALVISAAVLNAWSLMYVNYVLAWLALPFLFYILLKTTSRHKIVLFGGLFGSVSSLLLNFWMIPVIHHYAQGSMLIGIACWMVSALVLGLLFGIQFYLYSVIKLPESRKYAFLSNGLLLAALWVLFEWFRAEMFSGIPWLSYSVGITHASNLLLIQPAALGGVYLLSFLTVCSTYFISYAFFRKEWKWLLVPAFAIALQFTVGFLLLNNIREEITTKSGKKFSAALLLAALPPETVWNESSADALVKHLLSLNQLAVAKAPDLIVWSETIVPWPYAPDDDFLAEITKATSGRNIPTLLGMNSAADSTGNTLRNSVYLLGPDGKATARYDKQTLLTFVETPLFDENGAFILPFLSNSGIKMHSGSYNPPMETPWGKAGILLCNESTYAINPRKFVQKGASYLINMGNDSWFSDYFITRQHFYNARLRAVENRKDILVNNNMGCSGLVKATGEITAQYDGKSRGVKLVEVTPNHINPINDQCFTSLILSTITILMITRMYLMLKLKNVK